MNLGLEGKVAIVTGAAAGIGKGIARVLAEEGCNVVIADIDGKKGETTASELNSMGSGEKCVAVATDVSSEESVGRMVERTVEEFATVHILVNNVGLTIAGWIEEIDLAAIRKTFDVNMLGYLLTTKAVVPHMKKQRFGRLIYMSSGSGQKGSSGLSLYSASKSFDIGFGKAIGQELGKHNITSNVVCPSDVFPEAQYEAGSWKESRLAEITKEKLGVSSLDEIKAKRETSNPMRRNCTVEDVAYYVAFLASERASFVNAQTHGINGGAIPG
jgi:NAD(P)-dependent dehydrogenase (short-subunit alcohol dehydrogenase family)